MPTKRSGQPANPSSAPTDYRAWKAHAGAMLERQGISAGAIPEKVWRGLYQSPGHAKGGGRGGARVHYENFIRRPAFAPRKR
jgi:hypothetical protein